MSYPKEKPDRIIEFFLPGRPKAWTRTQPILAGGRFVGMKNTRADTDYKAYVALSFRRAVENSARPPEDFPWPKPGSVSLTIYALLPDVKGRGKPTSRPDLSNIIKLVEDGLLKLAYQDDSQITKITGEKRYRGTNPEGTLVYLEFYGEREKS